MNVKSKTTIHASNITKISNEDLLNQVDALLNFDKNRGNNLVKINNLFNVYNKILNHKTSDDFKLSLYNSEVLTNIIDFTDSMPYKPIYSLDKSDFYHLNKGNANSFLIIPIHSASHTFAVVVRRLDEGFSATLVNRDTEHFRFKKPSQDNIYGQY